MPNIMNRTSQRSSWHTVTKSLLLTLTSILVYGVTGADATTLTCGSCHETIPVDGSDRFSTIGRFQGSHNKHAGTSGQNHPCADCHPNNTTMTHSGGNIEMASPIHSTANASYSKGTSFAISNATTLTGGVCYNTYCHSDGTGKTLNAGDTRLITSNASPAWGQSTTCKSCHGTTGAAADGRPNYANNTPKKNSHQAATHLSKTCDTCHDAVTYSGGTYTPLTSIHNRGTYSIKTALGYTYALGGGTCATPGCHGSGQWGVTTFNCVTCHASTVDITAGPLGTTNGGASWVNKRRAVSTEFLSTWSHARSFIGANGNFTTIGGLPTGLCVACHMEGNPDTGSPMASYHGNGFVELRDPDTGITIENVMWVTMLTTNGGGWYTSAGTPLNTMSAFRRNLASASLEPEVQATQINFCLKCHDGDGALSTLARVGTTNRSSVAALQPFNVVVRDWTTTSAMSSMGNSNGSGNVVNVKRSFMTTNASYHPVMGKGNNSYANATRMVAPWNSLTRSMGTNSQWGYLISCWDCHAPSAATGMQTYSVTAHGAPATLRGLIRGGTLGTSAANNLCMNCHVGYYAGNSNHTSTANATASAFSVGGSSMSATMSSCFWCHGVGSGISSVPVAGSTTLTTALARPLRAEDVHGFNDRFPNVAGSKWGSGNRAYSFVRFVLQEWRPTRSPEMATAGTTGICYSGLTDRTCNDNMSNRTYAPGGAY